MDMKKILSLIFLVLLSSCSEPTERIEKKLLTYLQEDLKFMVAETLNANATKADLLEEPYYKIRDFRLFEGAEAEIYAAYAEVDFYIYRDLAMYEKRKYRYEVHGRHWDRYSKVLKFGKDKNP
ncbi:hypothetical protein B7982_10390 [Fibrobacter sp. UWB2]|jgi:hypothetical protein|uniref:Lipoprotein n=2 Tax=Fibrobacteraceae TaxID=204431 RepID=A0A380S8K2_FIBSU|nr:hypothetical protein [Fibrobacter sp.]OWV21847.1 hypothetical protein B7982_10390 [Fibrobacter sp. UWB2]PWJ34925.1 hypothetical protein IE02_2463 [Fibrobacter succinogenes subsp. elongatus]SUQ25048.1 hypothetical protein SAMN05661053_2463 [Fibrobacter succinogenes]